MVPSPDPLSMAMVDLIQEQGYAVQISQNGKSFSAVATHADGWIGAAESGKLYLALCALAVKIHFARPSV